MSVILANQVKEAIARLATNLDQALLHVKSAVESSSKSLESNGSNYSTQLQELNASRMTPGTRA